MSTTNTTKADVRTIKVIVRHCTVKKGPQTGKKFDAYRAVQNHGVLIDCHFRREVANIPCENFLMRVDASKMNVSHKYEYPRLWVSEVIEFLPVKREEENVEDVELPF